MVDHGVVHRDLKPGNILLTNRGDENDVVKVLDFGLVKDVTGDAEDLTQQGLFMGSPKYMAPEQITGGEISARTDIYSLGVMIYEMMTGKVPFDRGASVNTLMAHVNDVPPPLADVNPKIQISPQMESIIYRCLEKDASRRFASMNELLVALKRTGDPTMTDTHDNLPAAYLGRASSGGDSGPTSAAIAIPASVRNPPLSPDIAPPEPSMSPSRTPGPFNSSRPADPSNSDLQAGAPSLSAFSQKKSRATSYILVGLAAAAIAAVAFLSLRKPPEATGSGVLATTGPATTGAETAPTTAAITSSAAAPATSSATAAPATTVPDRVVRIETEPQGAAVSEDGKELCPSTPCDIVFKDDGGPKEHKLALTRKGYKGKELVVSATDTKATTKMEVGWVGAANPGPVTPGTSTGPAPARFDACFDDSDCRGGRKCIHGFCK